MRPEDVLGVVRRTIAQRALLGAGRERGQTILVACSGGADSCGLLFALSRLAPELSLTLVAASVDHGLRASAAQDVAVAAAQAARLDVPFRALAVQVARVGSLQAAARVARYDALRALAAREGASLIAVGHTRDDQAETVLSRMLRGGSVRALGGIAPRRADGIIRPLLDCSRAQVRALVLAQRLPFIDDPSNLQRRFLRARLRAEVMPALLAIDPRVNEHLADLADDARSADRALRSGAARLLARAGRDAPELAVLGRAAPALARGALARWVRQLTNRAASRAHVEALEQLVRTGRGEVRLAVGWVARAEAGRLVAEGGHAPLQRRSGGATNGA